MSAEDVATILARMTQAAPEFRGMEAKVQMVTLTAVIDDKITEEGQLKMQKAKNGTLRAVIEFSKPADSSRSIGIFGKTIRIYYPNANYYQDYDAGKNASLLNQLLLLGFGSSGEELAKSYTISPDGVEKVSDTNTTKLLLTPKDPKVLQRLTKVELWIPEGGSNPIQQQFFEPTGNYRKVTYSDMQLNPSFKGNLELQMHPGTTKRSS